MPVHTFIADSAADAIAQIRETLGPHAIVLNVRRPPVEGFARLWQKPLIEVLAHVPDKPVPPVQPDVLAELREELRAIGRQMSEARSGVWGRESEVWSREASEARLETLDSGHKTFDSRGGWRAGALLENSGVLPLHAQRVVEELRLLHGDTPPDSLAQELELARNVLLGRWKKSASPREAVSGVRCAGEGVRCEVSGVRSPGPSHLTPGTSHLAPSADTHVFIGPPGSGKTTCLCKWLALTALVEGRSASVWRLDGQVANTAESLSVYCEILDVPLERRLPPVGSPLRAVGSAPEAREIARSVAMGEAGAVFSRGKAPDEEVLFIDLPGVDPSDVVAFSSLADQLNRLPNPQVHLVLNVAYEMPRLLAQARAFARLPITDLIVTHLDEEPRWGKLWNFVLAPWSSGVPGAAGSGQDYSTGRGTNCPLRFLSAGQNIPGEFLEASPDRILARQFPRKQAVCGAV